MATGIRMGSVRKVPKGISRILYHHAIIKALGPQFGTLEAAFGKFDEWCRLKCFVFYGVTYFGSMRPSGRPYGTTSFI